MTKNTRPKVIEAGATRPLTRSRAWFGPGLLLAVIVIWFLWPRLTTQNNLSFSERPPFAAQSAVPVALSSAPDPDWLITQRGELQLNAAQWQKLSHLQARWGRDTRSLQSALQQASTDFERRMTNEQRHEQRGVTTEQLQEQAAPLSELSRQLGDARRAWWDEAKMLLTPAQRQRAEKAWTQHLTRRFRVP